MSRRFGVRTTGLQGVVVLERRPIGDSRGYLERMFSASVLAEWASGRPIVQVNRTVTGERGTVRGMHFQRAPHAETKFVSCLRGEVFDVAVDLRAGSPTFLGWHAEVLSAENRLTMVVPEGCAHGLQTLTPDCELLYMHTAEYAPGLEGGVHCQDPALGIEWPLPIGELSPRDRSHAAITPDFAGLGS